MKVLVACEYSGIVREAFRKKGHDAWSCDLLPTEIPGQHIQGDAVEAINKGGWDLMIAHPPCTDLAVAGAPSFAKKRADGTQRKSIDFFMEFVHSNIPKWCIENPISIMSTIYRKPDQIVQPYYFGDKQTKKICLWLKGLPPLLHDKSKWVEPEYLVYKSKKTKSGFSKYPLQWKSGNGHTRSKFYLGVATAMAEQWG